MSRSRRKTPIRGTTLADSEKENKKDWHKKMRRVTKSKLISANTESDSIYPEELDVSNEWMFDKDGKWYFGNRNKELLRK